MKKAGDKFVKPIVASVERIEEYFDARNSEHEMDYGLIRIMLDDDGLSITNPGGFVEGVTLENLLTVEPHGRNMALADALKRVGLAERTGRGIDRIYEGSLMYGRPIPDYSSSDNQTVRLFIQRANADLSFTKMVADEENRRHIDCLIN